jgi:hypothetical protein
MTPLLASAIFAAPARADQFGGCETTIRAMEAREILAMMQKERVG